MAGSNIVHVAGVRFRVVGTGNLQLSFKGYDDVDTQTLVPIAMTTSPGREKTRLANFISQSTRLRGETTEINEIMRVNHIWIYAKEIWKNYPE